MLSLAQQQENLRAIVQGRPADTLGDRWLTEVSASQGLQVLRATIAWWQRFQIEAQCRYTSRLLKRLDRFERCVEACYRDHSAPPSIEELSTMFLRSLETHEELLVRAVAAFELACLAPPRPGEPGRTIEWDRNPVDMILALDRCEPLPHPEPGAQYILRIAAHLPGGMQCIREELPA